MDIGFAESKSAARISSYVVLALSIIFSAIVGLSLMRNLTTAFGRNGLTRLVIATHHGRDSGCVYYRLVNILVMPHGAGPYAWQILFNLGVVRCATLIALSALMLHAWIGIWVVSTDYVKSATVRLLTLIFVYCWLLLDFIWCVQILWGD